MDPIAQVAVHITLAQPNQNLVAEPIVDSGVYSILFNPPFLRCSGTSHPHNHHPTGLTSPHASWQHSHTGFEPLLDRRGLCGSLRLTRSRAAALINPIHHPTNYQTGLTLRMMAQFTWGFEPCYFSVTGLVSVCLAATILWSLAIFRVGIHLSMTGCPYPTMIVIHHR